MSLSLLSLSLLTSEAHVVVRFYCYLTQIFSRFHVLVDSYQQDIGGPSQCLYNDATCAEDYPETAFLFVREDTGSIIRGSSCLDILDNNPSTAGADGTYVITQVRQF